MRFFLSVGRKDTAGSIVRPLASVCNNSSPIFLALFSSRAYSRFLLCKKDGPSVAVPAGYALYSMSNNKESLTSAWQTSRNDMFGLSRCPQPPSMTSAWFILGPFFGAKARKMKPLLSCHHDNQLCKNDRSSFAAINKSRRFLTVS